jgi:predicted esterase
MLQVCVRPRGAKAVVCLVIGCLLSFFATAEAAAEPLDLAESETEPGVVVYRSSAAGPRPITVVLHGMCGEPARTCSHFAEQVTRSEHLICPRARSRCEGGGSSFSQAAFAPEVEAAVARALRSLSGSVDERRGRTLIGYSLGAFRALDIAEASHGRYPRVMLIGARLYPSLRSLRGNGVERLLMAAGDWDMTSAHMRRQTVLLARAGFPASFLRLGPVGHAFTASFGGHLASALGFLHGEQADVATADLR